MKREPGGTAFAESIRQLLLNPQQEIVAEDTELLLMFAARAQHIAEVINPNLEQGRWVLSDRFTDASYAYQGGGRGIDSKRITVLEEWVQGTLKPDLTILLDAPVEIALTRMKNRDTPDRIEQEQQSFFQRVRDCYLQRAKAEPNRFRIIDASLPLAEVEKNITNILAKYLQHEAV